MEDTLISFETAKLAKEKEFLEISNYPLWFHSNGVEASDFEDLWNVKKSEYFKHECILRPTQSLLQKWLREVHNIEVLIGRIPPEAVLADKNKGKNILKNYNCYIWNLNSNPRIANNGTFLDIYEEALEIGLYQALLLI